MKIKTAIAAAVMLTATGLLRADSLTVMLVNKDNTALLERTEWEITGPGYQKSLTAGSIHRFELPRGKYKITATTVRSGKTGTRSFWFTSETTGRIIVN